MYPLQIVPSYRTFAGTERILIDVVPRPLSSQTQAWAPIKPSPSPGRAVYRIDGGSAPVVWGLEKAKFVVLGSSGCNPWTAELTTSTALPRK